MSNGKHSDLSQVPTMGEEAEENIKLLREDYDRMMDELSERELRKIQDRADKASKLIGSQESIDFLNQTWNEGSTKQI